jgi:hypothetical protein
MRSTTQKAALAFGVVFLLVGLLGFFVPGGMGMESMPDRAPHLLGLFPVNVLHNAVHLAFGVAGVLASRSLGASRAYHRTGAAIYLVLTLLAFLDPTTFGLVPIGGNDIWLHAVLAVGMGYFGFLHREVGAAARL